MSEEKTYCVLTRDRKEIDEATKVSISKLKLVPLVGRRTV